MANEWYWDWVNPSSALKQNMIKGNMPFEIHYVKDIMSTKLSMFQYRHIERIPDLDSRTLEMALMFSNFLCFYKDAALGWGLYRYCVDGDLDRYLRPQFVKIMTLKGVTVANHVPFKDIILARDNEMDIPPFLCIFEYLVKMQHIDSVIFKTLDISALPLVLAGSKKLVNQFNAILKNLTGGKMLIAGDDTLIDAIKAFKIDIPVQPVDTYELKKQYPDAKVLVHPECKKEIADLADVVGSTQALLNYAVDGEYTQFLVCTESGILHEMQKRCPQKEFIPVPPAGRACSKNECDYMRMNTLEKLYLCLRDEMPAIEVDEAIRERAVRPIHKMLEMSK